jgi:antitoxin FitA
MTQLILNDVDPLILEKLKMRAVTHQRSLEEELKAILQEVVEAEQSAKMSEFREQAAQIRQAMSGQTYSDSAELVREDRSR